MAIAQSVEGIVQDDGNTDASGQYLTFMLASEEYGLEILRVQEIKGWDRATPIPNTPEHVLGVLNLRGAIVPIIDLRMRFGLEQVPYGPTTVVIVVRTHTEDQERTVGLVVDAVADVYRLEQSEIQPAPELGDDTSSQYISGLATVSGKMVVLLNIDALIDFDANDVNAMASMEAARSAGDAVAAG